MSVTEGDRNSIRGLLAQSEERVYRRIKDNALGEIRGEIREVVEVQGSCH